MATLSLRTRFEVLKRDRFTCQYCGAAGGTLEVDHVKPICEGGSDDPKNLVTACFECNRGKSGTSLIERKLPRTVAPSVRYAIHKLPDGRVDWVGRIVERSDSVISCDTIDAICAISGVWSLTGRVETAPANEWVLYTNKFKAIAACHRANGG